MTVDKDYVPLIDNTDITLGTIGGKDCLTTDGLVITQDVFITRTDYIIHWKNSNRSDDGPLVVGMADGGLTLTEIDEHLSLVGPESPSVNEDDEKARRKVDILAVLVNQETGSDGIIVPVKHGQYNTRKRYTASGGGWTWFVYNLGDVTATGGLIRIHAKHHARWLI